ncbi:MAG: zinc ribbon domain-containing protein [Gemmatimonadota bacterium]|nr:zinc ribbon domain-containing protein [Gemmatimonadota bacterium]
MSDQRDGADQAADGGTEKSGTDETVDCPNCGAGVAGAFCSQCGAPVRARFCNACGEKAKAGDRFCTACGAGLGAGAQTASGRPSQGGSPARAAGSARPAGGAAAAGRARSAADPARPGGGERQQWLIWVTIALMLGGGAAVIGYSTRPGAGGPGVAAGPGVVGASSVDLSTMTPREAADRLFNRVVSSAEQGDSAQMLQFLPMSIQAYDVAEPLDDDGYFHKSILQRLAGDTEGAIASAETALARSPDHLLALNTAAEAARESGDTERARTYYQRFLDAYDAEIAKDLPEYQIHSALLDGMRADALTGVA